MDAAESLPDMLWSSLLWPSASYGTEPCMPADCAATFASRRVQVVCLPLWKLNHEFQWLAIDTDMDGAAMVHREDPPTASACVLDSSEGQRSRKQFRDVEILCNAVEIPRPKVVHDRNG